jgi:hypothetical protein
LALKNCSKGLMGTKEDFAVGIVMKGKKAIKTSV